MGDWSLGGLSGTRMMSQVVLLATMFAGAGAMELMKDNWDKETAGKSVFVKFLAPQELSISQL